MEWVKLDPICLDFEIHFSLEKRIRGTGGGIKQAATLLDRPPFLVINGDILIDLDLDKLMAFHQGKKSILTMVLREDPMSSSYGVIKIDEKNKLMDIYYFSDKSFTGFDLSKMTYSKCAHARDMNHCIKIKTKNE